MSQLLHIEPLAPRLEPHAATDGFGDALETEWTLVDPQSQAPVVMLVVLNEEGEAYARKLALAYNHFNAVFDALIDLVAAEDRYVGETGFKLDDPISDAVEVARKVTNQARAESEVRS